MSKAEFNYEKIKDILPINHLSVISKQIEEEFEKVISKRHLRYILKGERTDKYNVIEKAITLSEVEIEKRKSIQKRLKKLTK